MKIVISQPHGNPNTLAAVKSLEKFGLLDTFWTTIAFPFKFKILGKKFYDINYRKIKLRFFKEFLRKICIFLKLKKFFTNDDSILSTNSIYKDLDVTVSRYLEKKKNISAIYSYEDCALNSFRSAKKNKIKTIYDLTAPYWSLKKKILEEEINLHPGWNLSSTEILSKNKCINKDEEISLSDQIIVASTFTAKSLELFDKNIKSKINVVPYGINCPNENIINKRNENDKLRLIFIGRPTLSKGIQYLIQILESIDFPWQLEIAGHLPESPHDISKKMHSFFTDNRCNYLGQISNEKLLVKMRESHVLMFPSLFEGFGQVLLEALSCSLPIITTVNTGGSEIIDNGKDGFITPIRDVQKSIKILNQLYSDEEFRRSVSENAFLKANNYTWSKYQNEISKLVKI